MNATLDRREISPVPEHPNLVFIKMDEEEAAATCNAFNTLTAAGLGEKLAFRGQHDSTSFMVEHCDIFPIDLIVTRDAVRFYLKTDGTKCPDWYDHQIKNPQMTVTDQKIRLYIPDREPGKSVRPFMTRKVDGAFAANLKIRVGTFFQMEQIARSAFMILQKAWAAGSSIENRILVSRRIKFGRNGRGNLMITHIN